MAKQKFTGRFDTALLGYAMNNHRRLGFNSTADMLNGALKVIYANEKEYLIMQKKLIVRQLNYIDALLGDIEEKEQQTGKALKIIRGSQ